MDFITSLPKDQGSNAFSTCVYKLTKLVRLTPCRMGEGLPSAEQTVKLFYDNVVRPFGVPNTVFHDLDVVQRSIHLHQIALIYIYAA